LGTGLQTIGANDGLPVNADERLQMKSTRPPNSPRVLVIDVGGTHVKLLASGQTEPLKIPSDRTLTPVKMVRTVKKAVCDWRFDRITLGYPGPIINGHPLREPHNLGRGWVGFDFSKAFGCPVRMINDAAMQALGSYQGGRMLFLGLGTGLGSAMIVDGILEPMELAHLVYKQGKTYEDYLGLRGLERMGKKKWRRYVAKITKKLRAALGADYVVLGGGNCKKLKEPPPKARLGSNENAFIGGFRVWAKPIGSAKHKTPETNDLFAVEQPRQNASPRYIPLPQRSKLDEGG
jgi:polyphosphate glucokinase